MRIVEFVIAMASPAGEKVARKIDRANARVNKNIM
jgi:hypothetical protein